MAERSHSDLSQASLYLSYLGCAIARTQRRTKEARALCRHAVKVEFFQPENWANLAEVMMLSKRRKGAVEALQQGLEIDPQNRRLQKLSQELGMRRPPVLPFLARSNPLNHLLGRLRNDIFGSVRPKRPD